MLAALDFLASVVTPILCANSGSLDRLAIHNAYTGLSISVQANSQAFTDSPVEYFQLLSLRHFLKE
jgi:hypothetical protein